MSNRRHLSFDEIAEIAVKYLDGKLYSDRFTCLCPAHPDKNPSLSGRRADNGNGALLKCFKGCEFPDILRGFCRFIGPSLFINLPRTATENNAATDEAKKERAHQMWRASRSLADASRAMEYFKHRGLYEVRTNELRFHPNLRHLSNQFFPAILAKIAALNGDFLGLHRTYLSHNGVGKAPVEPNKMMLGNLLDGAVHLAEAGPALMIGEGIETCLSAMQATGIPAWSALSASRLARVSIPDYVREIIILADHDAAGIKAAHAAGRRWIGQGLRVRIAQPPAPGQDFNDILHGEG